MKKLSLLFLTFLIISCSKEDETKINSDIVGKWKLIEILADPGDGSGTFHSVNSQKVLEFHSNGKITSNGSICKMSIESDTPSSGTFSLEESKITVSDCGYLNFTKEGNILIVYYLCIEGCQCKFKKE